MRLKYQTSLNLSGDQDNLILVCRQSCLKSSDRSFNVIINSQLKTFTIHNQNTGGEEEAHKNS